MMDSIEIIKLAQDIRDIEAKKETLLESVFDAAQKTIKEWSKVTDRNKFKQAIYSVIHIKLLTQYGAKNFPNNIQKQFESEVKSMFKSSDRYFYYDEIPQFIQLLKAQPNSRTRKFDQTIVVDVNDGLLFEYHYVGTAYHGYGSIQNHVEQELIIDITTMTLVDYNLSTASVNIFCHDREVNTDFIDRLIDTHE